MEHLHNVRDVDGSHDVVWRVLRQEEPTGCRRPEDAQSDTDRRTYLRGIGHGNG
jgi:hypothetical protein